MINIGIDGYRFSSPYQTGKEVFVRNLYPNLFNLDKENRYIVYTLTEIDDIFNDNAKIIKIKSVPYYFVWNQFALPLNIKSTNIDLMIYNESMVPFLNKTPCILIIYDLSFLIIESEFNKKTTLIYKNTIKYSANAAKLIVAISESTKHDIIKYLNISPEKVVVVPLALPASFTKELKTSCENENNILDKYRIGGRYIITIGSTHRYKNIGRLILAFNKLRMQLEYRNLTLVIVGKKTDGYDINKDGNFNDSIIQTDYVNDQDLIVLLKNASVFCFPSLYEGFGIPLLEAMALGVPIVASNRSSIPEILGDAGLLFDPLSVDEIADNIHCLLSDYELRNRCVNNGFIRSNIFKWEISAKILLDKIESAF